MINKLVKDIYRLDIVKSISMLSGNRRALAFFEPLFGISFVLFNFYMSLYMKEIGLSNAQLGYISSIGYISAAFFSFLGGPIVDKIGRRKSLFLFDLFGWGGALILWLFAHNFLLFALAAIFNNLVRVSMVSYMCLVSEGSVSEERVATYNLKNISNLCIGILVPIAGIVVGHYGIISGQRIMIAFGLIGIIVMDFARNKCLRETDEGLMLIHAQKISGSLKLKIINPEALRRISENKVVLLVMLAGIFQQLFLVLSPFNGVFFAPFFSEVIKFNKAQISYLGSINSFVMLVVFLFVIPSILKRNNIHNLISGIGIQIFSVICMMLIPKGNFIISAVSMTVYALGFSVTRAFIDSVLVNVTEFKEKAGIYSIYNGVSCLLCIFASAFMGIIYNITPYLLALISLVFLVTSFVLLIFVLLKNKEKALQPAKE